MKASLLATVLFSVGLTCSAASDASLTQTDVFVSGNDGYHSYRIPAIETAPDGSIIAFAEARKYNADDPGFGRQDIDLVYKCSTDNGVSWSVMTVLEDPGESWSAANPATLVDRSNGRLWVFYLRSRPGRSTETSRPGTDDMQTLARWSADNGQNWSEPVDLTDIARDMEDTGWRASVPGPGGAIQARNGRLLVPMWKAPFANFIIYSDDHGDTWKRSQLVPANDGGNENQLAALADGRILMDIRQENRPQRSFAESADGGLSWSEPRPGIPVTPVMCAIERFCPPGESECNRILWTGPAGQERRRLMLRISEDEGKTFPAEKLISDGYAAYSDLTILKSGDVGVLWERGVQRGYQFITFTALDRNWITEKSTGDTQTARSKSTVILQNTHLRYSIGANGTNLEFIDRATGSNYLREDAPSACGWVRTKGTNHLATSVSLENERLSLEFGESGGKAVLRVESRGSYICLTVESVTGPGIDSLVFLNVPLTVQGRPEEAFGACAYSLNLTTRVDALPALQRELRAACYEKFGLVGASAAIVGVPMDQMLPTLKEVLSDADEMPHCPVAGPWAGEIPFNHGSYLFNFGALTESNVDDWIAMARSLGVTQIDNHGGGAFFRFGDFALNRDKWPDGWQGYKRIVQRLHDAGISSIFHSYAFFIDKRSKYVTPVPDKRLDAFRSFSLAAPLSHDATELVVNEPTDGMSTVTGFFEHNSVVLHVDDELVTFGSVSKEPPWRFAKLTRGAFGTKPAVHEKGAKARHLKECFGLLVPDVESSLFEEIARNHAEIVNACGFDGIYLDAIDGSSILRGADECWFWADKFVFEIQRHLRKPVGMEMSAMWHHFWQYRTRWQAWDYPQRGHKRFVDLHAESVNGGLLLPLHLGWWNFQSFDPPQVEPTYPDVIEYLGAKLIGWDVGISLAGAIDPERLKAVPLFRRAVDILRQYEELRRTGSVRESVRAKLREPGSEFSLARDHDGSWRFRPARTDAHTISAGEPWSLRWSVDNTFETQPLRFRLEALMSTSSYDDPGNIVLADPSAPETFLAGPQSADGVNASLEAVPGMPAGQLSAVNSGVPRRSAWARLERRYDPAVSLKDHRALGLEIDGDGLGEIIAVRLESPEHVSFGAVADRYVTVDFTGRRVFSLVETESARWSDYVWNDGKSLYNAYRETIDFNNVQRVSLWYNNLPHGQTRCTVGAVKALRMLPCIVRNPAITVNGRTLVLPAEIPSGGYLCSEQDGWIVYGAKGETLRTVKLAGPALELRGGPNQVEFSCTPDGGPPARARLVVFSHGNPL